jgi:hypothetical protein
MFQAWQEQESQCPSGASNLVGDGQHVRIPRLKVFTP